MPLFVGEETTEGRVSQSNGLVSAKALGVVGIGNSPVVTLNERSNAGGGVYEINGGPLGASVSPTSRDAGVGVWTLVVASQTVVEGVLLDDQFQGGVLGPLEPEETGKEILGRLGHAILGG